MLLLIFNYSGYKTSIIKIQIHRMLLLIGVLSITFVIFSSDSNTSYVAINRTCLHNISLCLEYSNTSYVAINLPTPQAVQVLADYSNTSYVAINHYNFIMLFIATGIQIHRMLLLINLCKLLHIFNN